MSAPQPVENLKATHLMKKADMLDQVNELLDLMLSEKSTLQTKISELESELKQGHGRREDSSPDSSSPVAEGGLARLVEKIEKERDSIRLLEERVNLLQAYVSSERDTLRAKIDEIHTKHLDAMKKQQRENKRLEHVLAQCKDGNHQLEISNNALKSAVEGMRNRYIRTRTAYLAVKGRNAAKDKPDTTAVMQEHERLMQDLEKERAERIVLQQQLEDKVKSEGILQQKLTNEIRRSEDLHHQYMTVKRQVGGQLTHVDIELSKARDELDELRTHLVNKQTELNYVHQTLLRERRWTHKILTQGKTKVDHMATEHTKHQLVSANKIDKLKTKLTMERRQHGQEMNRIKDVCTKRCTELAQELWLLKAKLNLQKEN